MNRLRLTRVEIDYVKYLYRFDKKIQYNEKEADNYTVRRPYVGVVIAIGEYNYFAPLESPKKNHKNLKNNPHILKINTGRDGLIAFGNMIPIREAELVSFDINKEEKIYREILKRQVIFCNDNKETIKAHAIKTYENVTIKRDKFFRKACCDFELLERKCKEYRGK